jgi:hypothetical protein
MAVIHRWTALGLFCAALCPILSAQDSKAHIDRVFLDGKIWTA